MGKQTIYQIEGVKVNLLESLPPQLVINAEGLVPTEGWANPELVPYVYITPPLDGIQDFGFIAEPPPEISLQVLTPITVSFHMKDMPSWLRGVRVHASANSVEALINNPAAGKGHKICIKGELTDEGVECQTLRTPNGELYTLITCNLDNFQIGDIVYVYGTTVPISFCNQGTTVAVEWIGKEMEKIKGTTPVN